MFKRNSKKCKYILAFTVALAAIILVINTSTSVLKLVYPLKYKENVFTYSQIHKIDPYLVFAIIKAESGFDPDATSPKQAKGLMQITDETGKWGAGSLKMGNFTPHCLYEPETNINIGCWYLSKLMTEFGNDVDLVIAAYNGGSGNVSKWLKDRALSNTGESLDRIPFKETEKFVVKVKNYYSVYKRLYDKKPPV